MPNHKLLVTRRVKRDPPTELQSSPQFKENGVFLYSKMKDILFTMTPTKEAGATKTTIRPLPSLVNINAPSETSQPSISHSAQTNVASVVEEELKRMDMTKLDVEDYWLVGSTIEKDMKVLLFHIFWRLRYEGAILKAYKGMIEYGRASRQLAPIKFNSGDERVHNIGAMIVECFPKFWTLINMDINTSTMYHVPVVWLSTQVVRSKMPLDHLLVILSQVDDEIFVGMDASVQIPVIEYSDGEEDDEVMAGSQAGYFASVLTGFTRVISFTEMLVSWEDRYRTASVAYSNFFGSPPS